MYFQAAKDLAALLNSPLVLANVSSYMVLSSTKQLMLLLWAAVLTLVLTHGTSGTVPALTWNYY